MHVFGLPEIELAACPQHLLQVGQMLLLGTAQHLVHAAMQHIHDADKQALVQDAPKTFAVDAEIDVGGALLSDAIAGDAQATTRSTRVLLTLPEDFQGRIVRLMPPETLSQHEGSWMQRACDELSGPQVLQTESQPTDEASPNPIDRRGGTSQQEMQP